MAPPTLCTESVTNFQPSIRDDQAGAAALGVVQGDLFGGDVVGCPRAGHRRHHEAVAQGQAGEVVGLE
jgi:hypothetical protein